MITLYFLVQFLETLCHAYIGLIIGSMFDRGRRADGDIRNDFPSTAGIILGPILGLIIRKLIFILLIKIAEII